MRLGINILLLTLLTHCQSYGQWVRTLFPASIGSPFTQLSRYCVSDRYLFVSTELKFYRSSNQGDTWENLQDSLPGGRRITGIAFSDGYIIASMFHWNPDSSGGVYRSSDYGLTWERVTGNGKTAGGIYRIYKHSNYLFGVVAAGLWRSSDNGSNWEIISDAAWGLDGTNKFVNSLTITNDNIVFASIRGVGIFRSNNLGESWQKANSSTLLMDITCIENSLFSAEGIRMHSSFDNGQNWTELELPIHPNLVTIASDSKNVYVGGWSVGDDNGNGKAVYFSTDLGSTWIDISDTLHQDQVYLLFSYSDYIFAGTKIGLWRRSISELEVNQGIQVVATAFPNPFGNQLTFPATINDQTIESITIFDVLGNELQHRDIPNYLDGEAYTIDTRELSSGSYFAQVITSTGKRHTLKLMKE